MVELHEHDINHLFEVLWPAMPFAEEHKIACLNNLRPIQSCFIKYPENKHDELLTALCSLSGIGITIGTGLIWSVFRTSRVPFDKYTFTHALNKGLVRTETISTRYTKCSDAIKNYCHLNNYEIVDFVREAINEVDDDCTIEPK